MVLDVFSRKIVGWAVSSRQGVELVQAFLRLAASTRGARKGILHSDQGSQYTALAYTEQCLAAGGQRPLGAVGSCYYNAMAESFFATLECEWPQRVRWAEGGDRSIYARPSHGSTACSTAQSSSANCQRRNGLQS